MFSLAVIWPLPSHANVFNTYWPQLFNRSDASPPQSLEPARSPPSAPPLPRYFVHNVKQGMRQPRAPGETIAKKPRFAARPVAQVAVRPFRVINANNRPASASTTNRISEDALADALKDVDTLNTTIRLDKPDSTAVEPSAPVRHTKENREPKDSKGRLTLIALTPAAAIPAAVVTPVKVQVAAADTEKQADMAWTSMPVARDLPPQVANLGESFIQNVFKQLPSSKKIRNSMPFDEFRLRIKEAIEVSPDVAVVSNLAEQSRSNKSLAMSSLLPQVNGTIDSGKRHTGRDPYLGSSPYEKDGNVTPSASSSVLVQLSIPFYNGGSDTAKKQDAKLKAMQSELEFQAAMRTFEKSLRQSQAEVLNSEDILASRAVSVRSAIASMRAVREQFAFNKGSLLDVISMQDSLFQAGRDMIDAQADRHLARYRLVHLTSELQKVFQLADQPLTVKD